MLEARSFTATAMQRGLLITFSVVIVLGLGVAAYVVFTAPTVSDTTANADANRNAGTTANTSPTNTNAVQPNATYAPFVGTDAGYTFDTVEEWTSIAPEEVQKSITEEQRNGYDIAYYAANPESVVLAVSEKRTDEEAGTLTDIVAGDIAKAEAYTESYSVAEQRVTERDGRTIATVTSGQTDYTVYSRYLLLPDTDDAAFRWALMEVSVPDGRTDAYADIVTHLLDSLMLRTY